MEVRSEKYQINRGMVYACPSSLQCSLQGARQQWPCPASCVCRWGAWEFAATTQTIQTLRHAVHADEAHISIHVLAYILCRNRFTNQ